ncbi:MAG: hypothetical protein IKE29_03490 [Paenibacillus sp.]|nr:hypothetical protein [Paenibacillus sp.]MBR2563662.1 hypothetical protein [Paenibacillus sp.]
MNVTLIQRPRRKLEPAPSRKLYAPACFILANDFSQKQAAHQGIHAFLYD